jgi:hypothetical protein
VTPSPVRERAVAPYYNKEKGIDTLLQQEGGHTPTRNVIANTREKPKEAAPKNNNIGSSKEATPTRTS